MHSGPHRWQRSASRQGIWAAAPPGSRSIVSILGEQSSSSSCLPNVLVPPRSVEFVEERRFALDRYLQELLAHEELSREPFGGAGPAGGLALLGVGTGVGAPKVPTPLPVRRQSRHASSLGCRRGGARALALRALKSRRACQLVSAPAPACHAHTLAECADLYEFLRSGSQLYELATPQQPPPRTSTTGCGCPPGLGAARPCGGWWATRALCLRPAAPAPCLMHARVGAPKLVHQGHMRAALCAGCWVGWARLPPATRRPWAAALPLRLAPWRALLQAL